MKITFYYKQSEKIGTKFRLALVHAYAAKLASMLRNGEISEKAKKEIDKTGEVKVYLFCIGDGMDYSKAYMKEHPNQVFFKHFTIPSLFLETKISSDSTPEDQIEMYPVLFIYGEYKDGCVELPALNECSGDHPLSYEPLFRHQESEYPLVYSVDVSLIDVVRKTYELHRDEQPTSYLNHHFFPSEIFLQLQKYIPVSKITVTKTGVMNAFEEAVDKEIMRLEEKGSSKKATRLKNAKERALQAAQSDEQMANSFDSLYTVEVDEQESVKTVARAALIDLGREYFRPLEKSLSSGLSGLFDSFKTTNPSFEEYSRKQKLKKEQRKLEKIRQEHNPITDTEENLLLARKKINKENPQKSRFGII